jgi:hypothetical protein
MGSDTEKHEGAMKTLINGFLFVLRSLFVGYVFAWLTVSMPLTELYVLLNLPYEQYMARDIEFEYETIRTFTVWLPRLGIFNFCVGTVIGALWHPKNLFNAMSASQ